MILRDICKRGRRMGGIWLQDAKLHSVGRRFSFSVPCPITLQVQKDKNKKMQSLFLATMTAICTNMRYISHIFQLQQIIKNGRIDLPADIL